MGWCVLRRMERRCQCGVGRYVVLPQIVAVTGRHAACGSCEAGSGMAPLITLALCAVLPFLCILSPTRATVSKAAVAARAQSWVGAAFKHGHQSTTGTDRMGQGCFASKGARRLHMPTKEVQLRPESLLQDMHMWATPECTCEGGSMEAINNAHVVAQVTRVQSRANPSTRP